MGILFSSKAERKEDGSLVLDANGFPKLAPQQGVIGNPNPDWRGGIGLKGYYKKLNFNVLLINVQICSNIYLIVNHTFYLIINNTSIIRRFLTNTINHSIK